MAESDPSEDIFAASGVDAPATDSAADGSPYRVLARKYRPSKFSELIGQDAMVQTLANAIRRDRLAHAFLMTGVRGVGKTSTARLIAKSLNCIGPDGTGGPTIDPCGECEPCRAISEGSFIDVIEMDAASHTGVDDVRDIIEAVRYASVSARYKIYIIDEVHMLSKNAFNALLKTLEEPPPHVKFLFATTEVDKVPVTVLSRCQRFDLKRISTDELAAHFHRIAELEKVEAEAEAIQLIALAAEGSVRDGLSILDQAIAHADLEGGAGEGRAAITPEQVRAMLGLSDRGAIRRLFAALLDAKPGTLLTAIEEQYRSGAEPGALMNGLLSLTHQLTLMQVGRAADATHSAEAVEELESWAAQISAPSLHRLWQLLLRGHEEVRAAHLPRETAEMALLRAMCAMELPDPGELARLMTERSPNAPVASEANSPERTAQTGTAEPAQPAMDYATLVDLVAAESPVIASILVHDVRVVRFAPPLLEYQSKRTISSDEIDQLVGILNERTGDDWTLRWAEGAAKPSMSEQRELDRQRDRQEVLDSPMVKAAMEAFPDAEILEVTEPEMDPIRDIAPAAPSEPTGRAQPREVSTA